MKIKNELKNTKGITLIALVITIIVLLILAGVSIATLTGPNGLLTRANEAKQATTEAGAKEKVLMEVAASYDNNGNFNMDKLKENLKTNLGLTESDIKDNGDGSVTVTIDGYEVNYKYGEDKIEEIKIESIKLSENTLTLKRGETYVLEASIIPENASNKEIIWKSSNDAIATINEKGEIETKGVGNCVLEASAKENENIKDTCEIKVEPKVINFYWDDFDKGYTVCQAIEGMTWREWCESEYNKTNFFISSNVVMAGPKGLYLLKNRENKEKTPADEIIIENYDYYSNSNFAL